MTQARNRTPSEEEEDDIDSEASIGPALPGQSRSRKPKAGPSIPNMQDLELKRGTELQYPIFVLTNDTLETEKEDGVNYRDDIRFERKQDRKSQAAALDELVPRADPGTRERQLEKKAEVNATMKSFRERSPGAVEVPDAELMGGGDGVGEYKKTIKEFERKKNEREVRREEILRARMAEREERLSEYRQKEDGTMDMLKALAKQKFG